jgi:AraC-like DNA-binding protein
MFVRGRPGWSVGRWFSFEERLPISAPRQGVVWWHQGRHYDHPRHRHAALELNLVVSGRGHYEVAGRCHPLSPGTALVISSGRDHFLEERTDDFQMWILAIQPALLERMHDGPEAREFLVAAEGGDCSRVLCPDDARWLAREIGRLAESCSHDFLHSGLAYLVAGTAEAWRRTRAAPPEAALSPDVRRSMTLLEDEPTLARDQLADRIGTSPDVLSRAFRRELGVSIVEYRNRLRLRRFMELAPSGQLTLLAACLEAGFGSYPQFHRVFVAETGRTPRAFLRSPRGKHDPGGALRAP